MVKKTFCDICGTDVAPNQHMLELDSMDGHGYEAYADLCVDHAKEIYELIRTFMTQREAK